MTSNRIGEKTLKLTAPVYIRGIGSVVGEDEAKGPIKQYFDVLDKDLLHRKESFEQAERRFFSNATRQALHNAGLGARDMDFLVGGDLLNQIISAAYAARDLDIPFLGLYGACSSMAQSMAISSMLIDGGFAENIVCATSSHFGAAERQFRYPLELGTPKPPTGQNTVTGAGATVLSTQPSELCIKYVQVGNVLDFGINDANNMGAAMAPAAAQTILTVLDDLQVQPDHFDAIVTGDLGVFGSEMLLDLCAQAGTDIAGVHKDCGVMIFEGVPKKDSGGSGCACSATVLNGYFLKRMLAGKLSRILFVATGALHGPTTIQQGESIPGIAHAVVIERSDI